MMVISLALGAVSAGSLAYFKWRGLPYTQEQYYLCLFGLTCTALGLGTRVLEAM